MRDNLYNEDDPMLITKKIGHMLTVKSNTKLNRLPETMHLNNNSVINHTKRLSSLIIISMNNFLAHLSIKR